MTVSNATVSILFAAVLSVLPGCAKFPRTSEAAGSLFGTATTRQGFFYTPDPHAGYSRPGCSPVTFNLFERFNSRLIVRCKSLGMTS